MNWSAAWSLIIFLAWLPSRCCGEPPTTQWVLREPLHLGPLPQTTMPSSPVADCAANSVFLTCRLLGIDITYEKCLELTPLRKEGNSALEVKKALLSLGVDVQAVRLKHDEVGALSKVAIVWDAPLEVPGVTTSHGIGHFSIIRPLPNHLFQTVDFPREPVVFSATDWRSFMEATHIDDVLLLECSRQGPSTVPLPNAAAAAPPDAKILIRPYGAETNPIIAQKQVGDQAEGNTIVYKVRLSNPGDVDLKIRKIDWQCTCTSVVSSSTEVPAGGDIDVYMNVSLRHRYGPFDATAVVQFLDEKIPPIYLVVAGEVHARWVSDPDIINCGYLTPSTRPIVRDVTLTSTKFAKGKIVRCEAKSPGLSCELLPAVYGELTKLRIKFDPTGAKNLYLGQIYYYEDNDTEPVNAIEVRAEIIPLIEAIPSEVVTFPSKNIDDFPKVMFRSFNDKVMHLESWSADLNGLKIEDVSTNAGTVTLKIVNSSDVRLLQEGTARFSFKVDGMSELSTIAVPIVLMPSEMQ